MQCKSFSIIDNLTFILVVRLIVQIKRLEHVNRKLGGTNGVSKFSKHYDGSSSSSGQHQQQKNQDALFQDLSDDDDMNNFKLKIASTPHTSVENLTFT